MEGTQMRATIAATAMVVLALGQAYAQQAKSMPADVGPGRAAWFDITTKSVAKASDFYGKLFGWTFNPVQGTDQAVEIVSRGTAIGTIRGADGPIGSFNGVVYIQVADIRESCRKAEELGGTLVPGFPFDLPDGTGAIGLVTDPSGHPIGLYSRTPLAAKKAGAKP